MFRTKDTYSHTDKLLVTIYWLTMTGPRTGHPPPLFWSHRISWVSPSPLLASMWVQSGCYATLCLVFYLDAFSCNRWVWDIWAFRDFRNSATLPTHLLTLPCISGSLSDLLSRHGCVAIPGCLTHSEFLSDYPCCPPTSLVHVQCGQQQTFCLLLSLYQCTSPGPLLTALLWLMRSFTGGWLRCACSALFLNVCIHEQSCFPLNLLSVSPEKNFKDWCRMPPCFMEPRQVEDLHETVVYFKQQILTYTIGISLPESNYFPTRNKSINRY